MTDEHNALDRRQFLQLSAASAVTLSAGLSLHSAPAVGQEAPFTPLSLPGRVLKVRHSGVIEDGERPDSDLIPEVAELLVDTALVLFTGQADVAAAWRQFVTPEDRVLLKVSCLGSPNMATNVAVVTAVVRGLQAAGVPSDHMVIYDQYSNRMRRANLRPGNDILGVPIEFSRDRGYQSDETTHASGGCKFANAFEQATAVISLPVFKDHDLSGFTGSLKNITHGCIDNPDRHHRNRCAAVADLYNTDMVKTRVRLTIADVIRLMYDGGPQDGPGKELLNTIMVATDPVAVDTVGYDLINEARARHGLSSLADDRREPTFLTAAADLGLGTHDRERITIEEHVLA